MPLVWTDLAPLTDMPFGVTAAAWDGERFVAHVAGGTIDDATAQTWEFTTDWSQLTPVTAIKEHSGQLMCQGLSDGEVLLFGGSSYSGGVLAIRNDLWKFTTDWTHLSPATNPSARFAGGMVRAGSVVILFGGLNTDTTTYYNDTFSWNGTNWTDKSPASPPSVRAGCQLAYLNGHIYLFGGSTTAGALLDDTWDYDVVGNTWTQLSVTSKPSARSGHGFAYNGTSLLLYGGVDGTGEVGDSWVLDPSIPDWHQCSPSPNPGTRHGTQMLVGDGSRAALVSAVENEDAIGGFTTDTWAAEGDCYKPVYSISHSFGLRP